MRPSANGLGIRRRSGDDTPDRGRGRSHDWDAGRTHGGETTASVLLTRRLSPSQRGSTRPTSRRSTSCISAPCPPWQRARHSGSYRWIRKPARRLDAAWIQHFRSTSEGCPASTRPEHSAPACNARRLRGSWTLSSLRTRAGFATEPPLHAGNAVRHALRGGTDDLVSCTHALLRSQVPPRA